MRNIIDKKSKIWWSNILLINLFLNSVLVPSIYDVYDQKSKHCKSWKSKQDPHRPSLIQNIIHSKVTKRHFSNVRCSSVADSCLLWFLLILNPGVSFVFLNNVHNEAKDSNKNEHEEEHVKYVPLEWEIQREPWTKNVQSICICTYSKLFHKLRGRHVATLTN